MRVCALLVLFAAAASAQQPPSTDIWVVSLRDSAGHTTAAGAARNVTSRAGYDNQPAWSRAGDAIFFSSQRDGAQNDIWRVALATGAATRVTTTAPESEYSPTLMPGGAALSVVKVERDSAQRLWRIPLDGGAASVILPNVKPVGYHAWADANTLGLFVLGTPATFQVADVRAGTATVIAADVQRGIAKIPGANALSFIHRVSRDESWLMRFDVATRDTVRIARMMSGVQDYAWTPRGVLLAGQESRLYAWNRESGWVVIADFARDGVRGITRLAVSVAGDAVAFVAQDKLP